MKAGRLELPEGIQFGAIYADPPWPLDQENTKYSRRRIIYDRMSFDEIAAIPVGMVCTPDTHLWLWTTNPHLPMALEVVKAWGFTYKTMATWVKTKITTGWWLRGRTEHLILASRSDKLRHNPGNWTTEIKGKWRAHSVKPEEGYERVEALSPTPYLELFSRREDRRNEHWWHLGKPQLPVDPFGQEEQYKKRGVFIPDPQDGKVRGVGGLEIHVGRQYTYLVKKVVPVKVKAVSQKDRRVTILIPGENGDGPVKKSVAIDHLRPNAYKVAK